MSQDQKFTLVIRVGEVTSKQKFSFHEASPPPNMAEADLTNKQINGKNLNHSNCEADHHPDALV